MLGFGGWPLSSDADVLLHGQQEVFGSLPPLPERSAPADDKAGAAPPETDALPEPYAPQS
jgi:hypothetical protein